MLPLVEAEHRLATERAQAVLRGEEPPPVPDERPPPLLFDYNGEKDGTLRCPFCNSSDLRLVQLFLDADSGETGSLIGCFGCRRGFGVVVFGDEQERRVKVGVRPVGT